MGWKEEHSHANEEALFIWQVRSSRVSKSGKSPLYTVSLYKDGCISCDCPGWMFKRTGKPRGCKHTISLEEEAKQYLKMHKKGEKLPELILPESVSSSPLSKKEEVSTIQYGRVLQFD